MIMIPKVTFTGPKTLERYTFFKKLRFIIVIFIFFIINNIVSI